MATITVLSDISMAPGSAMPGGAAVRSPQAFTFSPVPVRHLHARYVAPVLVLTGVGLAMLFESRVQAYLARRELVAVLERFSTPFPGLYLYYPQRRHASPSLDRRVPARFARILVVAPSSSPIS